MVKDAYAEESKNSGILPDAALLNHVLLASYSVQDLPERELFLHFQ